MPSVAVILCNMTIVRNRVYNNIAVLATASKLLSGEVTMQIESPLQFRTQSSRHPKSTCVYLAFG